MYKNSQSTPDNIKIGVLGIASGDGAAWGESARRGINLAVEEFKKENSMIAIEVVYEDTGGDPKRAVTSYQKLISIDRADVIIGPLFQSEVAAIAPLVAKDGVPVVALSYAPLQNRPNLRNPLVIWMDATIEAQRIAEYVYDQGARTAGVLGTKDNWENEVSNAFADKFQSLGGTIFNKEIVQSDSVDTKLPITRILSQKPEAIFLGTYYQFVSGLKTLKNLRFPGKVYSIEVDSYLADQTKAYSSGLRFIGPDFYVGDFMNKFEARFGQKPGIPAGQSYDVANILLSFIRKSRNAQDILQMMRDFKEYKGVSGTITVTDDNKVLFPTAIFEIQNGQVVKIQ